MDDSNTWRRVGLDVIHAETVVKELVQDERNDDDDVGEERERTDSEREDDDDEIEAAATSPAHEENFASNSPSPSPSPSFSSVSSFDGSPSPGSKLLTMRKGGPGIIELRRIAKAHISKEEFQEALSLLNECIESNSRSANLFRLRCLCYSRLGMHEESLQDAYMIEKLKPKSCTSYFHLGSALYGVCDYSGAAKAFQTGLLINSQDKALLEGFRNAVTMITNLRNELISKVRDEAGKTMTTPPQAATT